MFSKRNKKILSTSPMPSSSSLLNRLLHFLLVVAAVLAQGDDYPDYQDYADYGSGEQQDNLYADYAARQEVKQGGG